MTSTQTKTTPDKIGILLTKIEVRYLVDLLEMMLQEKPRRLWRPGEYALEGILKRLPDDRKVI